MKTGQSWNNESDSVVADLRPIIPPLYQGIEGAMQQAREIFVNENRPVDKCLFPDLVRYYALPIFTQLGLNPQHLNNNGLSITFGRYRLRSLKDKNGHFPTPGPTYARQCFWQQTALPLPPMLSALMDRRGGSLNLVLMWEATSKYTLKQLTLGYPKDGTHNPTSAEWHWKQVLVHPAYTFAPEPLMQFDDEVDDLDDYSLPKDETTGTGDKE